MEAIVDLIMAAIMFVGSWGFSYGYTFDDNCLKHDYLIPREIGIRDTFVLSLNEDGTAEMNQDGNLFYGEWTNEDGLHEYSVLFPEQGLNYTMRIEDEDSVNFEPGMLILEDTSGGYLLYCFRRVWQCGECAAWNEESARFCSQCGAAKTEQGE